MSDIDDEDPEETPPLDFSPSSTAVDATAALKDTATATATGRHDYTPNATYIGGEIGGSNEIGLTLNQLNRGWRHTDEPTPDEETPKQAQRSRDRANDIAAWGDTVGLTDAETARAATLVAAIPSAVLRTYSVEATILAALTLAANEQHGSNTTTAKSIRRRGPDTGHPDLVAAYERLRADLGVDPETVTRARSWCQSHDITDD